MEKEIKELLTKRQIKISSFTPHIVGLAWRAHLPNYNYDGIATYDFVCAARMLSIAHFHKVNRCLARCSLRHNHQPTHQQGTHGKAWQKCKFQVKFGRFWAKDPNFIGEIKSFVIHITKNHLDTLFALVFGRAWDEMDKNANIYPKWPKMLILDQFWPFWGQKS